MCAIKKILVRFSKLQLYSNSSGLAMSQNFIRAMATLVVLQLLGIGSYLCVAEITPIHIRP